MKWETYGDEDNGGINAGNDNLIPFYVTRKTSSGMTYAWKISTDNAMRILLIGQLAVLLWLFIALVAALVLIIGTGIDVVGDIYDWAADSSRPWVQ